MNMVTALDTTFSEGPHKGKTVGEVWYTHRDYVLSGDVSLNDVAAQAVLFLRTNSREATEAASPKPSAQRPTTTETAKVVSEVVASREALVRLIASELTFAIQHKHFTGYLRVGNPANKSEVPPTTADVREFGEKSSGYRALVRVTYPTKEKTSNSSISPERVPTRVGTVIVYHTDVKKYGNVLPVNVPVFEADLPAMISTPGRYLPRFFPDLSKPDALRGFAPPDFEAENSRNAADIDKGW